MPEEPGNKSLVIDKATYDRLLRACNFKSKEQLEQEKEQLNTQRDQLLSDINERKKIIQQYDSERKKNEKLAEIDQLAKEEAEYLLKKANELRQEQEDEVKRLNEVSYKCLKSPTCPKTAHLFSHLVAHTGCQSSCHT